MLIYVIVYTFNVFVAIQNEGKSYEDYTVSNGLPNHKRYKKCEFWGPSNTTAVLFIAHSTLQKVMLMHWMQTNNFSLGSHLMLEQFTVGTILSVMKSLFLIKGLFVIHIFNE